MTSFRLAILDLTRRKVPSFITLMAIAVSVGFSGVLLRLYWLSSSRLSTLGHGGEAIVGAKSGGVEILLGALNLEGPYPDFIPLVLYESLKNRSQVKFEDGAVSNPSYIESAIPVVYFAEFKKYRVIGTDESFLNRPNNYDKLALVQGRWAGEHEVVVGSEVAAREQLKVGDKISITSWTGDSSEPVPTPPTPAAPKGPAVTVTVSGLLVTTNSAWDFALYSTLAEAGSMFKASGISSIWQEHVLHYFLMYLKPGGFEPLQNLINRRTVAQVVLVDREIAKLRQWTGTGKAIGFFVSCLVLFLGGLCVMAVMITRFDGMAVQLAVLRALGYNRRSIRGWLLWEGLVLGLIAIVVGALLDQLCFPWLRAGLGQALPQLVSAPLFWSAPVWCIALLSTIVAIYFPIYRLYGKDVHQALKGL